MHSYKLYKRFNGINDNIFLKYNQPPPPLLGLNSCSTSVKKKSAIRSIVKWPTTCSKMRLNAMTLVLSHIFKTFPYSFTWKHCNLFSIDWSSNVMPGFTATLFFRQTKFGWSTNLFMSWFQAVIRLFNVFLYNLPLSLHVLGMIVFPRFVE